MSDGAAGVRDYLDADAPADGVLLDLQLEDGTMPAALTTELMSIINDDPPELSPQELQVLYLHGTGSTLAATARRLGIAIPTVRPIWTGSARSGPPPTNRSRTSAASSTSTRDTPTRRAMTLQVTGVVEADQGRRPVRLPPHHGDGAVGLVEADPTPIRRVEHVTDEPPDHEVVRDEQFVPVVVAGDTEVFDSLP